MPALYLQDAGSAAQVRAVLDSMLDEDLLSRDIIEMSVFAGSAEAEVKLADPLWATRTEAQKERLTNAVIYLTAARISPTLPGLTGLQVGDFRWTRGPWDGRKRAAELRGLAAAELAAVLEDSGVVAPLPAFWVAPGYRGR